MAFAGLELVILLKPLLTSVVGVKVVSCRVVLAHDFSPSTQEAEAGESLEFDTSLLYRTSAQTARSTQRNPVSKTKTKQTNKQPNQTKNNALPQTSLI